MHTRRGLAFFFAALIIARSTIAAAADVAPAAPAPHIANAATAALDSPVPTAVPASAMVRLDAPAGATLEVRTPTAWVPICTAPCDMQLSTLDRYRVAREVRPSSEFTLAAPRPDERVVIHVIPASQGRFVAGIVATSVGGGATLAGLLIWAEAAVCGNGNECASPASPSLEAAGIGIAVAGVVTLITGLALTVPNVHSRTSQETAPSPRASGPSLHLGAALGPVTDDPIRGLAASLPRPMSSPVFAVSF